MVFKTLPIAFRQMHFGNFFAAAFFVLLLIAALTTSLAICQVMIAVLNEKFGMRLNGAINVVLFGVFIPGNVPCILSTGLLEDVRIFGRSVFDAFDFSQATSALCSRPWAAPCM